MSTKGKTFTKGTHPYDTGIPDDCPVTKRELALAFRTSRWTINQLIKDLKYEFQFGRNRTTPGHFKKWMEDHKDRLQNADDARYQEAKARLK
jgi:hypothetical protein